MIARRQARPATRNLINSKSNDIKDALNVAAWSLWNDLANTWPNKMTNLHRNKHAADIVEDIQHGVHAAIRLTEGEDEQAVDNHYIQKRMKEIFPMRPKDLIPWFHHYLDIKLTKSRISNWKARGQIQPRFSTKEGWDYFHPADVLRTIDTDQRHDIQKQLHSINPI